MQKSLSPAGQTMSFYTGKQDWKAPALGQHAHTLAQNHPKIISSNRTTQITQNKLYNSIKPFMEER
ncbi:MAG TPA: hypothetical protein PKI59_08350 [Candidatus Cloacimonadota bacterium]|nr:hypothetical protein [Candidatus Cloacimonadota bacterium]